MLKKMLAPQVVRIAVPVLAVVGFFLYHLLDNPDGGAVRWPGVVLWLAAGLMGVAYQRGNPRRPVKLLWAATGCELVAAMAFVIALLTNDLSGIVWYLYVALPLAGLGIMLLLASLYV